MSKKLHIASKPVYNSETGQLFNTGEVIPDIAENEVLLSAKTRRGRKGIPGVDEEKASTETRIAGSGKAKAGAGQDGRKPAPKAPEKIKIDGRRVAEDQGGVDGTGDVEIGGQTRVTPSGGKVQDAAPSVLD